jgi:hypothetical protein
VRRLHPRRQHPLLAAVGPVPSILNIDPAPLGLTQPRSTRPQLATMVMCALECAQDSDALLRMPPECEGVAAVQLVATFFLWSMENPFPVYRFITDPLNVSGTRSKEALQQQLPLIKLLCIAHRAVPRSSVLWCSFRPSIPHRLRLYSPPPCRYDGVLYRGINIDLNAVMRQKYDAYETAFAVGTKLTFPAPTACSTSDVVAGHFMNGMQLVIHKAGGVALLPGQLSAYDESEVLLPFPCSFKVTARSKVQDTVVVMIEAVPSVFSYCSDPEALVASEDAFASACLFMRERSSSAYNVGTFVARVWCISLNLRPKLPYLHSLFVDVAHAPTSGHARSF